MESSKTFFYAKTLNDVFYQLKTISDLAIVGACTSFVDKELHEKSLSIRDLEELKIIDKHERYIDLGAAVTLSEIEELGEANLPATIYTAITSIANPNVRNIATIGGNICSKEFYNTLYAPLLALDARLEFQSNENTFFQNITRLESIPNGTLLTKVRIPFEEWEVAIFQRLGIPNTLNKFSASFVFLANSQKNQISDLRLSFAGSFKFRDIDLENKLIGAHLPLSEAAISNFIIEAKSAFENAINSKEVEAILKKQFLNLVRYSLEQLT